MIRPVGIQTRKGSIAGALLTLLVFASLLCGCEFFGRPADIETPDQETPDSPVDPEQQEEEHEGPVPAQSGEFDFDLSLISSENDPNVYSARLQLTRGFRTDSFTVDIVSDRVASSVVRVEGQIFLDSTVVFVPLKTYYSGWHRVDVSAADIAGYESAKGLDFYVSSVSPEEGKWTVKSLYIPTSEVSIELGSFAELTAEWNPVRPEPAYEDWSWTVEPEGIVSLEHWGQTVRLTALAEGSATVKVSCRGASTSVAVTVTKKGEDPEPVKEIGKIAYSVSERADFAWINGKGDDMIAVGPSNIGTYHVKASAEEGLTFDYSACASRCSFTDAGSKGGNYRWTASMGTPGESEATVFRTEGSSYVSKKIPVLVYGTVALKGWCSWSGITKKKIAQSLTLGFTITNNVAPALRGAFTVRVRIDALMKDGKTVSYSCPERSVPQMALGNGAEYSWSVSSEAEKLMDLISGKGYALTDISSMMVQMDWTAQLNDSFIRMTWSGRQIDGVAAITTGSGTTASLDARVKSYLGID